MGAAWMDLKYAMRSLLNRPGIAAIVILTLALGIGANTAIFSVVNAVVLRPLPYDHADRLVMVWETFRQSQQGSVSYPNLADWKAQNEVFETIAAFHPDAYTLTGIDQPERIRGARVTADFFPMLGVDAALGRLFAQEDDVAGAPNVAVLGDDLWRRRFAADPDIIGRMITLDARAFTVVGVLPAGFEFPVRIGQAELWTPTALDAREFTERGWPVLQVAAKLRPDATVAQAQAQMDTIQARLAEQYPETSADHGMRVVPLHEQVVGNVRPVLVVLLGAVGLVLLIACANIANLLLARSAGRREEFAVRAALGAGRMRLVRQLLTESLLLGLMGGALGVLAALWGLEALIAIIPADVPRTENIALDGVVLAFTLLVTLLTGVVFGLAPALHAARLNLHDTLKEGGRLRGGGRHRLRTTLVVSEVALALVLLIGAGLLLRSFDRLTNVDPGFDAENVLSFNMNVGWQGYTMPVQQRADFYSEIVQRLEALPGVESACAGASLPLQRVQMFPFDIEGRPEPPRSERPRARYNSITPGYFQTMRIPLLAGRTFDERDARDRRPGALIINQSMARQFWPDEDPIGQTIKAVIDITDIDPVHYEIVGVVGDVRGMSLDAEPVACMYAPHQQQTFPFMQFAMRFTGDDAALAVSARDVVAELTNDEAAYGFALMDETLAGSRSVAQRRFPMLLLGIFATVALTLAAVGIYGVLSYSVAQRTHEIGIRMAIGAQRRDVLRHVMTQGAILTGAGLGIGVLAALLGSRVLADLLFGVGPADPLTFLVVSLLLACVALLACYLPARRATRVDPMVALRYE